MQFINMAEKFDKLSKSLKETKSQPEEKIQVIDNPVVKEKSFQEQILEELADPALQSMIAEIQEAEQKNHEEHSIRNPYKQNEYIKIKRTEDGSFDIVGESKLRNMITFKARVNQQEISSFLKYGKPFPMGSYSEIQ